MQNKLYQRIQYQKGGITKIYWDYRDETIIRRIKGSVILDIGCGEGITLEKLIRRFPGKDIQGIDYSRENVEICKKNNLPVEYGSVYAIGLADNSIDTCLLIEVIEHLDNYTAALKELYRVLKSGGVLLLLFPNDINFKLARIMTGKFKEAAYDAGHIRQWRPGTLSKELVKAGFEITEIKNIPLYFWQVSLHSLITAKKT
jgi:ubiquinone/menaquinone biosynthesis C-methylase UbiE